MCVERAFVLQCVAPGSHRFSLAPVSFSDLGSPRRVLDGTCNLDWQDQSIKGPTCGTYVQLRVGDWLRFGSGKKGPVPGPRRHFSAVTLLPSER